MLIYHVRVLNSLFFPQLPIGGGNETALSRSKGTFLEKRKRERKRFLILGRSICALTCNDQSLIEWI